jgi:amino acid permease
MAIRYFDQSYFPGGAFFELMKYKKPLSSVRFGSDGYALNHLTFVLLSTLSTAYIAHYNAPKFYNELSDNKMNRFNKMVGGAFGASIALFCFIMSIGFLTFGSVTQGNILNNYASQDRLASLARFAVGLTLVTGYPFTFLSLRENLLDIMGKKDEKERKALFKPLTLSLIIAVTALALVVKDVGFVVSVTGALFGCFLMFIVPAVMNLSNKVTTLSDMERMGNMGMIGTGIVMGVLGVYVSVMKQLGKL